MKKSQKKKTEQEKFQERIVNIFLNAGFTYFKTEKDIFNLENEEPIELDHIFVYQNIIIECEDTINSYTYRKIDKKDKEKRENLKLRADKHKNNKKKAADIILNNKKEFIKELKNKYKSFNPNNKYYDSDFKIFFLYFDYMSEEPTQEQIKKYSPIIFVSQATMEYFCTISSSIKKSFRYELFRFLGIKREEVTDSADEDVRRTLNCPIVYPERWVGFSNGIRVVTFMIQPKILLETACVLRKDSWDGKDDLYQRLITEKRIKEIRNFLVNEKSTFLNNIIVTLPDTVSISDKDNKQVDIKDINGTKEQYQINIPLEFNSMAIIDGQHRVYAFFEDTKADDIEIEIARQRDSHCLLVTGIIYPKNQEWTDLRKRQFESRLFLAINRNSKQVDADTLILVQTILDPTSREGISRKVIESMNKRAPFEKMFKLTKVSDAPISISSIVQYALVSLVTTNINKDKKIKSQKTLFYYWLIETGRDKQYQFNISDRDKYVTFCANCLCEYFKAIRDHFINEWDNPKSKILNVLGINSFIISYRETLDLTNGPQKCQYYINMMSGWEYTFLDSPYSGSSYAKLAQNDIIPWFKRKITEASTRTPKE